MNLKILKMSLCNGCKIEIEDSNILVCTVCKGKYHIQCLGMKLDHYMSLSKEYCSNWICPSCLNSNRRRPRTNADTPVRQLHAPVPAEDSSEFLDTIEPVPSTTMQSTSTLVTEQVTTEQFNQLLQAINMWRVDMNKNVTNIRDDIKGTLAEIQADMRSLQSEQITMKQEISHISSELKSLQNTVQNQSSENLLLKKRVDDIEDVATVATTLDRHNPAYSDLESKIDYLEQQARQCNIEICNVPERRGENLMDIMEALGSALKVTFFQNDVVSIHRVPQAQQGGDRPKNIIAKFTTRVQRDNLLSAFRKVKSTITSDDLNIPGTSTKVYINEHLTLKKKHLFRKCRQAGKELQYKHTWVRNSAIFIREEDDSPVIVIRSEQDLEKLYQQTKQGNQQ